MQRGAGAVGPELGFKERRGATDLHSSGAGRRGGVRTLIVVIGCLDLLLRAAAPLDPASTRASLQLT